MIQRSIHYKSDFKLRLANEIDWSTPFKARFFTTRPVSAMEVRYDGTTYRGCSVDTEGKLVVTFDRFTQLHRQGLGALMMELSYNIDDDQFADRSFDRILAPQKVVCIDDEDNEFELVLGLNGDSHVEVECSVIAAYKKGDPGDTPEIGENGNWWIGGVDTEVKADYSSEEALRQSQEAARVAAETTRQSNETQRQSGETTRQSNESTRQSKETERQTNETARQNAEAQRQQTFSTNEAARQTAYQNAEANRNGAYEEAEQDRDEEFANKEATRDAANEAALNCAETLAALGPEIDGVEKQINGVEGFEETGTLAVDKDVSTSASLYIEKPLVAGETYTVLHSSTSAIAASFLLILLDSSDNSVSFHSPNSSTSVTYRKVNAGYSTTFVPEANVARVQLSCSRTITGTGDLVAVLSKESKEGLVDKVTSLQSSNTTLTNKVSTIEGNYLHYIGSYEGESIDDTTLEKGVYYCAASVAPYDTAGLLFVIGYANFIEQRFVSLVTNKEYTRVYNGNNGSWSAWKGTWAHYSNYKGTISSVNNADDMRDEGVWYFSASNPPTGTLPSLVSNGYYLLQVIGVGSNYVEQTLVCLTDNTRYKRTFSTTWSSWKQESTGGGGGSVDVEGFGEEYPNLLQNAMESGTANGITYTVNEDGSITCNGTSSGNAVRKINDVTLQKGAYWISGVSAQSTKQTYRIIRGDNSYSDLYFGGEAHPLSRIEVTADTETIQVYIKCQGTATNLKFYPMIQKIGIPYNGYVKYGVKASYGTFLEQYPHSAYNNYWKGKKMCVLGDSIAAGANGDIFNKVGMILGLADVHNFGVGGSRISYYGDGSSVTAEQSVVAKYSTIDEDADIIYIHGGTNDWASQVALGDADSNSNLEFNGALNIIMSGLRASHPKALIIFDTILPRVDYDAATHGGNTMSILTSSYSAAIMARCRDHHIVFFDIYEHCGLDFDYDYSNSVFATTDDGLHPNPNGAEILARKIAGFINWH